MTKNTWTYVKRASMRDKALMEELIREENKFQQQEPHGIDENDNDCPITFKLENHHGWQMNPYTPSGNRMPGFEESFIRCNVCGYITTYAGDDDNDQWCPHCNQFLEANMD